MKKRILFITQDLARTGSEVMLWYLFRNLDPLQYAIAVFCLRKGELYDVLPEHVKKNIGYKSSPSWFDRTFRRILKIFGIDPFAYQLNKIQEVFKADIWYINTIAIPDAFVVGKRMGVKTVIHIHELLNAFSLISRKAMKRIVADSDVCIGCSDMVCDAISALGHRDIRLQHSFLDTDTILVDQERVVRIRQELGILPTDFVWVVAGGALYMKGLDYVLSVLAHFKDEPVKLVWIGARFDNGLDFYIEKVAQLKYPGKLIFTGPQSADYYNYMSMAKGMLLLSREESFSLVMVEAAYLGIPVVAFNVGIAKQFLKPGMGVVVDNGDIGSLISEIRHLNANPELSNPAISKENAMLYSATKQLPKFEALFSTL